MDLKSELLRALNNPASVWDAILANLTNEPRLSLLVFTTCETPISLIAWQEAVARLSPDAAMRFEASLRVLDDSFVRVTKVAANRRHGAYWSVKFRNPSMDDFCAGYLDRNVGIVTNVVDCKPSLRQIARLVELGTAYAPLPEVGQFPRDRQYPNIYEAIMARPALLLARLLELLPEESAAYPASAAIMKHILTVMSQAREVLHSDFQTVQARLRPLIKTMRFGAAHNGFLYAALDNPPRAKLLRRLLDQDYEDFYKSLALSAFELDHFDSLVNFDEALGSSPTDADWAREFEVLTDEWLQREMRSEEVDSAREIYNKVTEYLNRERRPEWDEKYESAVQSERRDDEIQSDSGDDDWRDRTHKEGLARLRELSLIENMFDSLRAVD